ncbi:MAG: hypothetical protein Q4C88_03985 [Akkermansia sp.]|nr:hypothetical protein [Akkermansia sp.]
MLPGIATILKRVLPAAALALLIGCETAVVPEPELPRVCSQNSAAELSGRMLVERLHENWRQLMRRDLTDAERTQAVDAYNANLYLLVARLRYEMQEAEKGTMAELRQYVDVVQDVLPADMPLNLIYDDMVPARDVRFNELEEHYALPGLGVPMVGIIPAEKAQRLQNESVLNIRTKGTVSTVTAVLEFPAGKKGAKPRLHLVPRLSRESFPIGRLNYWLAADFSASIEVYWDLTEVDDDRFLGLLRPQELRDTTGLSSLEEYNPSKIPVILTHGLLSSAATFCNLVNRLQTDAEIRNHFQFWYFNYPTGPAWVQTAASYRQALADARKRLDPRHRNRNWDNMVVVGHSMGGLITHYSQCTEPWKLLSNSGVVKPESIRGLDASYVNKPFSDPAMESFRTQFFFEPVKAGAVFYLATPHRGAPLASYRIVKLIDKLISLPSSILNEAVSLVTLKRDIFLLNPSELTDWFTSLDQLSPDGYSIRGLRGLQVRNVPTYSVIGDRGDNDTPNSSDGVVPYWSSHISWGEETIVPSDHHVQDDKATAEYMKKILRAYLKTHRPKRIHAN